MVGATRSWFGSLGLGAVLLGSSVLFACSASSGGNKVSGGGSGSGGTAIGTGGGPVIGTGAQGSGGSGPITTAPPCDNPAPNADGDGDGVTPAAGDCNDCSDQINPGAYDYPGNGIDEDCSGTPDDEPVGCDTQTFDIGYGDPEVAARVIGVCRKANGPSWGLVSAKFVQADGTPGMNPLSHGLVPSFGPNVAPREGTNMLLLSSGTARRPGDIGYKSPGGAEMHTQASTPPGFPKDSPACSVTTANDKAARDSAALELVIRTPTNANELSFDFSFYTYEFPIYVCTQYNDFFVALVSPEPANAQSGNVSFDSQGNPVSVNNGFLEVCNAQTANGKNFPCARGPAELAGTGFDETGGKGPHAATGWLNTRAPVPSGQEITIRFAIWDMGDMILDSSVIIDNLSWKLGEGAPPVTEPVK